MTKPLGDDLHFFYGTLPQPCPYLPDRLESKVVTELTGDDARILHENLSHAGFRVSMVRPSVTPASLSLRVSLAPGDRRVSWVRGDVMVTWLAERTVKSTSESRQTTSWLSSAPLPHTLAAPSATASTTTRMST